MVDQEKPGQESKKDQPMAALETEAQSEIDQIMSEIEELQEEMNDAVTQQATSPESPVAVETVEEVNAEKELEALIQNELRQEAALIDRQVKDQQTTSTKPDSEVSAKRPLMNLVKDDMDEKPAQTRTESLNERNGTKNQDESSHSAGSLSMTVKGTMSLHLDYQDAGQSVVVAFSPNGIQILFADGTEFKIPNRVKNLRNVI